MIFKSCIVSKWILIFNFINEVLRVLLFCVTSYALVLSDGGRGRAFAAAAREARARGGERAQALSRRARPRPGERAAQVSRPLWRWCRGRGGARGRRGGETLSQTHHAAHRGRPLSVLRQRKRHAQHARRRVALRHHHPSRELAARDPAPGGEPAQDRPQPQTRWVWDERAFQAGCYGQSHTHTHTHITHHTSHTHTRTHTSELSYSFFCFIPFFYFSALESNEMNINKYSQV